METFAKQAGDEDLGKFYKMAKDPDTGKVVELRIRRLPAATARRLRRQKVKIKGDVTIVNVPEEELRQREEALACWTGSRNVVVKAKDDPSAAVYAKLCPGVSFPVGEEVNVDNALTDALKRDILTDYPEVVAFVRKRAKALQVADDEEEEDAQGNS
jgi:uncharacterized membrane-anchored protein YjiN (DUF445 family)